MDIYIKQVENPQNWDTELQKYEASLFLSHAWLDALKGVDKVPVYFMFYRDNQVLGMLAGLERVMGKGPQKQLFFFSGIACKSKDVDLLKYCKKSLLNYAINKRYFRVIFKSYDYTRFVRAKVKRLSEFQRSECVINLNRSTEQLEKSINRDFRRRARKSAREGVEIKQSHSPELLDKLFELLDLTQKTRIKKGYGKYRSLTMPFLDYEQMQNLLARGNANLYYAQYKGEIVSIQFVFYSIGRSYGLLMGTNSTGYKISAPSLLFIESIKFLKNKGCQSYNLGGVPLGKKHDGVRKYKLDMGAEIFFSSEETTGFLLSPLKKYNALLNLKDMLTSSPLPWRLKKMLFNGMRVFLKGKEHY